VQIGLHINISMQWRSKGEEGASGGTSPGMQALGAHHHTFAVI